MKSPYPLSDTSPSPGATSAFRTAARSISTSAWRSRYFYGDQIIVSASRRREKVLDAPASVAVVESEAVQTQRGLSAADYIVGLAGVDNAQTGLFQANTVARGFNNVFSGTLLTLVDNRITRVPSLRFNAHHFIPITNHDVDRVEVVLGPGSALYGPNSANGVMHIITRSPFGSEGTSVSVMGGERDLRNFSFRHAATTETVGMKLSGQYFSGTDWEHEDPEEVRLRGRNPRDYDVSRLSGELRLDVRPTEDLAGVLSAGFARLNSIEMTGIGAGQADGWTNYSLQGRLLFKDVFIQAFHNSSDAKDTKLLRTNDPIVDKSSFTVLQAQHSLERGRPPPGHLWGGRPVHAPEYRRDHKRRQRDPRQTLTNSGSTCRARAA